MAAIKPPYALVGVALALYLSSPLGFRAVLRSPEYYAAAGWASFMSPAVAPLFPAYVANELPFNAEVYVAGAREPWRRLLASPGR